MLTWSVESLFQMTQTIVLLLGIPVVAFRLGRGTEALRATIDAQGVTVTNIGKEIHDLKSEHRDFRNMLTQIAVQTQRLDTQDQQLAILMKSIDDLRRGEGFIFPLGTHGGSLGVKRP